MSLPLLYLSWDEHMLFSAPLCVALALEKTSFAQLQRLLLPKLYGAHPDFSKINWPKTQWFYEGRMFTPKLDKSVADHAIRANGVLRFRTPGLEGVRGCCG